MHVDYLIVGSGLTGATLARRLVDAGRDVLVLERRDHLGGNVHDHLHESGIRIHSYGPHYFRTSSERIWEFVNRFVAFHPFSAVLKSLVDGRMENWPVAASYIREHVGNDWKPEFSGKPTNFEEAALSLMPRLVYEKFIKEYSEKQWGVDARTLEAELCKRFDVRADDEPRLKPDAKYQGIPVGGYSALMRAMLQGISVELGCDYLTRKDAWLARKKLIFTGPIDELYGFELGKLQYRGQQRVHRYVADVQYAQPCVQVNAPAHALGPHIRTIEWKHMMEPRELAAVRGTVLTTEVPFSPQAPSAYEYPFPDASNAALYERYRKRADEDARLLVCGRLGEYRYYDMDQAIARAQVLADRLLQG